MGQFAYLTAEVLLPGGEGIDVLVDARVGLVCTHGVMIAQNEGLVPG